MPWITHQVSVPGGFLFVHERPPLHPLAPAWPALVLLHGFTGEGRSWDRVASLLPALRILAPDLPGHGASRFAHETRMCTFENTVALLRHMLDFFRVTACCLGGYSMGGRLALGFTLPHSERILGLYLESASPGLASAQEREARRRVDEELATFALERGVERFVQRWEDVPVLATGDRLPLAIREVQRAQRLRCRPEGLAASLRGSGTGSQPWLGGRLSEVDVPVQLVVGELDDKFRGIARDMKEKLRNSRLDVIPGVGHNVHLEAPEMVAQRLEAVVAAAGAGPRVPTPVP